MKSIFLGLLCVVMNSSSFAQFIQVGQDIDGITNDQSGYSVSLNSNGTRIAVGGPFNEDVANNNGVVRIYELNGTTWNQIGQDILGLENYVLGASIAINDAGNRVVIGVIGATPLGGTQDGIVQVYEFDGISWNLLGQTLNAENPSDRFGCSVAISANGDRIIAGAFDNDDGGAGAGSARVFDFNGTNWIQIGQDLNGTFSEKYGTAVSMDPTGSVVAIGGPSENEGVVRVFNYNGTMWVQIGTDIIGDQLGDEFGTSVSIGSDGNIVAVGAPFAGVLGSGIVKTYQIIGSNWNQVGQSIVGDNGDFIGDRESIALDPLGTKLVIGSRYSDANGINSGQAKVYYFDNVSWLFSGSVNGEVAGDEMGQVSISDDGQSIALGARKNSDGGNAAGQVRVYDLRGLGFEDNTISHFTVFPNPSNGLINIKSDKPITSIEVFDLQGRMLDKLAFSNTLQLIQTKGVYLLKMLQNEVSLGSLRIEIF